MTDTTETSRLVKETRSQRIKHFTSVSIINIRSQQFHIYPIVNHKWYHGLRIIMISQTLVIPFITQ